MIFPESLFTSTARDDVSTQWAPVYLNAAASGVAVTVDTPAIVVPAGRILALTGVNVIATPAAGIFPVAISYGITDNAANIIFNEIYTSLSRIGGVAESTSWPTEAYLISGSHRVFGRGVFSAGTGNNFVNLSIRGVLMVRGNASLA